MKSIARWRAGGVSVLALALFGTGSGGCNSHPIGDGAHDGGLERSPEEPMPVDALVGPDADAQVLDGGTCAVVIESHPDEGHYHIDCSSPVPYATDPPSSGDHNGTWAAYQTYDAPVAWINLVHSLEHGAIVIVYNCPGGCPDEVARAQAWIDALPPDPDCPSHRIILAPDPTLGVRWAASAWTWTLRADCFDEAAYTQFYADHYSHAAETICGGGASTIADGLCTPP